MSIPNVDVEVERLIYHMKERLAEAVVESATLHAALDQANERIAELEAKCQPAPLKAPRKSAH